MVLWTKWSVYLLLLFVALSAAIGPIQSVPSPSTLPTSSIPSTSSTSSSSTPTSTSVSTTSTSSSSSTSTSSTTETSSSSTTDSLSSSSSASSASISILSSSLSSLSSISSQSQINTPTVITNTISVTQSSTTSNNATTSPTSTSQSGGSNSIVIGAAIGGTVIALLAIAGIWYCTRSLRKKNQMTDFDEEIFAQPYTSQPIVKPVDMSQRPLGSNPEDAYQDISQMRQSRQSYIPRSPGYQPYQPPIHQNEAQLGYQPGYQPYPINGNAYSPPVAVNAGAGYGSPAAQEAYYQNQQYQQQQPPLNNVVQQPYQGQFSPAPDVNPTEDTRVWPSRPSSDNGVSGVAMSESRTAYDDDRSDVGLYKPDQNNHFEEINPHGPGHYNVERFSKPDSVDLYGGMALDDEA